jgi:hypothetical protein
LEHLASHLEVNLRPSLGYGVRGCQKPIERWVIDAVLHIASLSVRPRSLQPDLAIGTQIEEEGDDRRDREVSTADLVGTPEGGRSCGP